MPFKHPEQRRQYGRDWMRRNREKARAAMQRWRERHPEAHRAEVRAYYRRTDAKKIHRDGLDPHRVPYNRVSEAG